MSGARRGEPERVVVGLSWAAAELGVCVATARRLARRGELPGAFLLGDRWRVSPSAFRAGIEAKAAGTDRPATGPRVTQPTLFPLARPSVPARAPRGSQGHTGRQIAAEAARAPFSITGDAPLVRRRRSPGSAQSGGS